MKFGFCIGGDAGEIRLAELAGADYVETAFDMLARDDGTQYDAFAEELKRCSIPCESANCFLPGSLKVTGPNVDYEALRRYVGRGMERGAAIGLKTVVFGSGGARSVPEGWSFAEAFRQLARFLIEIAGPLAEKNGIRIAIEPLCDCNIINTGKEGVMLAAAADLPNVGGLVDLYHVVQIGERVNNIRDLKGNLFHSHIAEPTNRVFPSDPSEYDYKAFLDALEYAECPRCSVEARNNGFAEDSVRAMQVLKNL